MGASTILSRPAADTTITAQAADRYRIDFEGSLSELGKEGDSLVFTFNDGGKIRIDDFYAPKARSRKAVFEVDGEEFDAERFFTELRQPDLAPAAGPEEASGSNRFHDYEDMDILDGMGHLDGLDYRSSREFAYESAERDVAFSDDPDPFEDWAAVSEIPSTGEASRPEGSARPQPVPDAPQPSPELAPMPGPDPQPSPLPEPAPVPAPIPDPAPKPDPEPMPGRDPILPDPDPATPSAPMASPVQAREDGIASGDSVPVTIDGYEIIEVVRDGDHGTLEQGPDGNWHYTLKDPVDHPDEGQDILRSGDAVIIKVRDPEGNEYEIEQRIDIVDDVPEVESRSQETAAGDPEGVGGILKFGYGADGPGSVKVLINGKECQPGEDIPGEHGSLVFSPEGEYKYVSRPKGVYEPNGQDSFEIVITDADGDSRTGVLVVDVIKPQGPVAPPSVVDESKLEAGGATAEVVIEGYEIVEVRANGANGSLELQDGKWVYTLGHNMEHEIGHGRNTLEGADSVTVLVRDKWGNEYLVDKRIDVIDDIPTGSITNGEGALVAGQGVLEGRITANFGADSGPKQNITVTFGNEAVNLQPGMEIQGLYGTLVLDYHAGFRYTPKGLPADSQGGTDEFLFTVIDSDGDTCTMDIEGNPLKITVNVSKPEAPAADPVEARESGIRDGEASDVPGDGYEIVEVVEDGHKGTLEKDPDGEWHYTLKEPATHDGDNPDELPGGDTVKILVRTPDGNEYIIDQPITIVDDVPEIGDGTLEVKSGETGSGSVDKFDFGADDGDGKGVNILVDGEESGTTIRGEHGTLTINDDGSYSYKADALGVDTETATDTFTLQIRDADGDTDTGTITVNITKPAGPEPSEMTIHEKDMAGDLTVEGYTVIGVAGQGSKGTVSETENGFVYTLTDNLDHPVKGEADTIKGADTVKLIVRDADGNEYVVEKIINVIDDLPTASLEHEDYSVTLGKAVEISNRLAHDFGADNDTGKTSIKINGVQMRPGATVEGKYGVLTVGEDGNFTYKANPRSEDSATGRDEFTFTVTDSDGDSVSVDADGKPLTISIDVTEPQAPVTENIPVSEAGVDTGVPTPVPVAIDGYEIVEVVEDGGKGTLTKDDDGNWIYTPTEATDHSDAEDGEIKEDGDAVKIKVVDEDGNEFIIEQKFNILDDTPDAGSDERTVGTGETVTSSVLIDFGADNEAVDGGEAPSITITVNGEDHKPGDEIRGKHGTLTIDEKGGYAYTADPKDADDSAKPVKDIFTVTVRDSDGDEAEGTITINVMKPAGPTAQEITVNEHGLGDVADASESAAVDFGDYTIVAPENGKYEGGRGSLEFIDGQWRYTLSGNMDSGANAPDVDAERNAVAGADTIAVVVEDANRNKFTVNVKVNVIDDIPEAGITQSVSGTTAGDAAGVTGNLSVDFGADDDDGKASVRISVNGGEERELIRGQEIPGKYGKLVVDADGGYKYIANALGANEAGGRDEFSFAVIDSDGDRVTVDENDAPLKLSIDVKKPDGPETAPIEVSEANIGGENATVSVTIDGYEIVGIVPDDRDHKGEFTLEDGRLAYTLTDTATHEKGGESDKVLENGDYVTLIMRDANGNEYKVVQAVNIVDDNPDAGSDVKAVAPGAEISGEILVDFGADDGPEKSVTITIGENEVKAGEEIEGAFGKLTLNEDGTYRYVANAGSEGGRDVFDVVVKDADGDEAAGKITINVEKPSVIPTRPNIIELEDEHLVVDEKDMASDEGAKAGIAIIDKAGKEYTISEVLEDGFFGNVVRNEDGSWSYRLNTAYGHDKVDGRNTQVNGDYVKLKVVDEDGNEYVVNRKVDIIDDIPEMSLSECDLGKVMAGSESAVTGKLEYGFGADAGDGAKLVVTVDGQEIELESGRENVIQGKYGELVIAADGSYAYRATVNAAGQDSFQFRIEDADGDIVDADTSGNTFDVVVNIVEKKEPEPGEITVNERDLRGGGTVSAELTVDGCEIVGVVAKGARGQAELVNGKWVYTLDGAIYHPEQGADTAKDADTVTLKVRDEFGNEYEVEKTVNVIDDTPEMAVTGGGTIRGGETASGTIDHEFGADGAGQLVVSFGGKDYVLKEGEETVINGKFGDLTFNGDGTWDYKANEDNRFGRDNFQLKIVDGDGDMVDSEAGAGVLIGEKKPYEIDINVLPENVDVDPSIIYEQELAFGDIKLGVEVDGWTIVGAMPQGHAGTMVKDAQGNWQYVLKNALDHDNGVNIVDTVRLTLQNENGVTVEVDKRIDIVDDKPRLSLEDTDIPIADGIVVNERDLRDGGSAITKLECEGWEILGIAQNGELGEVKFIDGEWIYELNEAYTHFYTHVSGNTTTPYCPSIAQNVDYIYLNVRDENGYVYKVEVPVDIIDDHNIKISYINKYVAPGNTVQFIVAMPTGDDANADGYMEFYTRTVPNSFLQKNNLHYNADGTIAIADYTLLSSAGQTNQYIFSASGTWQESDCGIRVYGDCTYFYVHRIDYDVTPDQINGTSDNDFINPNQKFNQVSDKETTDSYWIPTSQENVIYGCGGNDWIAGEGVFFAADEKEKYEIFMDWVGGREIYSELKVEFDYCHENAKDLIAAYNEAIVRQTEIIYMYWDGKISLDEFSAMLSESGNIINEILTNELYESYISAEVNLKNYTDTINWATKLLSYNQLATYYPDLIYGGSGDDTIYLSGAGGVVFGDGTDKIGHDLYSEFLSAIGMNNKFYDLFFDIANLSFNRMQAISDMAEKFEQSSDGNDVINASNYSVIFGGGGDDNILSTYLYNDRIYYNTQNIIFAGSGNDLLSGGLYAFGGSGDDIIKNATYAFGGSGEDVIRIYDGTYCSNGYAFGGDENDIILWESEYNLTIEQNHQNITIDGGNDIDTVFLTNYNSNNSSVRYQFSTTNELSDGLKYGYIKDVEILVKANGQNAHTQANNGNINTIKDFLFSDGDHQILIDNVTNTIKLGNGWEHVGELSAGRDYYQTESYIYRIDDDNYYILETTLEVTNKEKKPGYEPYRAVISGHEANIAGQLNYSFGVDAGAGKKLVVLVNGEEHVYTVGKENTFTGEFGTLTIREDGLFSYKALPNVNGRDEFAFQIQDSDGSMITADLYGNPLKLLVDVEKPEMPVSPNINLDEPAYGSSLTAALDVNGYTIETIRMDAGEGKLVQNGTKWQYELDHNIDHSESNTYTDTVYVTYKDKFGNTYDVERKVNIRDDAPETGNIMVNLTNQFEYAGSSTIDESIEFFYNLGADRNPGEYSIVYNGIDGKVELAEGVETTVRGQYGDLVLTLNNGNVDFHYKADEEAEVKDTFKFTFTDSDGDSANSEIEIRTRFSIDLYEREMTDKGLTARVNLPAWLIDGNRIIDVEYQCHAGYTYQDADGNWYYHIDESLFDGEDDSEGNSVRDELVIWYRDEKGTLANIINQAYVFEKSVINPKADYDSFSNDIDEQIISSDNFAYAEAALALPAYLDGEIISATASGNAGEMYLGDDGTWYYRLDHGIDHSVLHDNGVENVYTDKVVIQVRNAAGEIEEIEKSIRIRDASPVCADMGMEHINTLEFVGEADAQRTSASLVSTGFLNMGGDANPDEGARITVTVGGQTYDVSLFEDTEIRGEFGTLTFNANGQGRFAYQYKADDAVDARETFTFTMTDADGDTNDATLDIDLKFTEDFDPSMAQPLDPGLPPFGNESHWEIVPDGDGTSIALDEGVAVGDEEDAEPEADNASMLPALEETEVAGMAGDGGGSGEDAPMTDRQAEGLDEGANNLPGSAEVEPSGNVSHDYEADAAMDGGHLEPEAEASDDDGAELVEYELDSVIDLDADPEPADVQTAALAGEGELIPGNAGPEVDAFDELMIFDLPVREGPTTIYGNIEENTEVEEDTAPVDDPILDADEGMMVFEDHDGDQAVPSAAHGDAENSLDSLDPSLASDPEPIYVPMESGSPDDLAIAAHSVEQG